ncbi:MULTISPECIES: hypothetical protein [unclassified Geodermatophilus]
MSTPTRNSVWRRMPIDQMEGIEEETGGVLHPEGGWALRRTDPRPPR